jgi:hypothetical protein
MKKMVMVTKKMQNENWCIWLCNNRTYEQNGHANENFENFDKKMQNENFELRYNTININQIVEAAGETQAFWFESHFKFTVSRTPISTNSVKEAVDSNGR